MKTGTICMLAAALSISTCCLAQEKGPAADAEHSRSASKTLIVSGRISADGKMLVTDLDSEWKIENAGVLKGHEGDLVRVRCVVDPDRGEIRILSVKKENGEAAYAARYADSAFRR